MGYVRLDLCYSAYDRVDMIQIFKQVQHGEYQGAMLAKVKEHNLTLTNAQTFVSDYIKFEVTAFGLLCIKY